MNLLPNTNTQGLAGTGTPLQPKKSSFFAPFGSNMPVSEVGQQENVGKTQSENRNIINEIFQIPQSLTPKLEYIKNFTFGRKEGPPQAQQVEEVKKASNMNQENKMIPNLSRLTTQGRLIRTQQTQRKFRAFEELETPYLIPEAIIPKPPTLKDIDMIDQEDMRPEQTLPSPIYQSDFLFLDEKAGNQYMPSTQQTQLKPQEQQVLPVQPASLPAIDPSQYIPSFQTIQKEHVHETKNQAMQEFEEYLRQERDLQSIKIELKEREENQLRFEAAVQFLEQTRVEKVNDTRSKIQQLIPQTEMSMSSNFFEFQPHLIYQEKKPVLPQSLQSIKAILPLDSKDAGILQETGLGYSFDNCTLYLWKLSNPTNTLYTLPRFSSKVLCVKSIQDQKSANLLLILTTEEIHLYQVKHNADQSFNLSPYVERVSTDRTRYFSIYQTQSRKVFIGGDNGKVSELKIDGVNNAGPQSKSKSQMVLKYLRGKVLGNEKSKMRKVDKSISQEEESVIQKIIGNFFERDRTVKRIVTCMAEDVSNKLLLLGVSDTSKSSDIEFYEMQSDELRLIQKISLSEIFEELKKRKIPINALPSQHIYKLFLINNELSIFLMTGPQITLQLSYSKKTLSYSILTALSPRFELFIDRYESLFDFDFIPDQLEDYQPWKPLTAKPSYISNVINLGQQVEVIDQQMNQDGQVAMLIRDSTKALVNNKSYLVLIQPNYRRGSLYKYSQYLLGMTEVTGCNQCFALQLSSTTQGRLTIQVLTDLGVQDFLVPNNEDIMLQYLNLLVNFQLNPPANRLQPDNQSIVSCIEKDFETYLTGQDIQVSLEALFKIIVSSNRASSPQEKFYRSEFAPLYYTNNDRIIRDGLQPGQSAFDPHQLRINLRSVARYVKNHLFQQDKASLIQVSKDHAALALRYFFNLSSTAENFQSNLVNDRTFLQAYRDYQHYNAQKMQSVLEKLRFNVIYKEIEIILRKVWGKKIIKEGNKGTAEPVLTIGETDVTFQKLRIIARFIQENLAALQSVSVEADYFKQDTIGGTTVPKNLKTEVASLIGIVFRFCQGLEILRDHVYSDKVLKSLNKDLIKLIAKCNLSEYLIQGITNPQACQLIESTVMQLDAKEIQYISSLSDFLPPDAVSIFLAKKYLSAAQALNSLKVRDEQSITSLKYSAHQEFMKFPLRVNFPIALQEYQQLDMLLEAVTLCLKCIDAVEDIRRLVNLKADKKDEFMVNVLQARQGQQDLAIKGIIDILHEIILRIETAEGRFKGKLKELQKDSFADKLRNRLSDQTLSIDYLKDLKQKILRLAGRTTSEFFHVQLYELLFSYSLQHDVKNLQNSSMKNVVKQLYSASETAIAMSEDQKLNLTKGKLEATFSHYVNANHFGKAFIEVMEQVCFAKEGANVGKMDIKDRIVWLQKAEGALVNYRNQIASQQQTRRNVDQEIELQEEIIKQLYLYKDYFLVLFQLRDAASERMKSQKKAAKLDSNIVDKLTYEIVEPNELCQIAIQLKQWVLYLRILEINEIYSYSSNGRVQVSYRTSEENKGTQDRIDFMYRALLSRQSSLQVLQSGRKYHRLVSNLKQLQEYSKAKSLQTVNMFPENLLITLLEDQHQETILASRSEDFYNQLQQWDDIWDTEKKHLIIKSLNIYWHLDLLVSDLGVKAETIFDALYSRIGKGMDPELYLTLAYLILKYKVSSDDQALRRLKMSQLLDWLKEAITDELVFPNDFIQKVKIVVAKLELRLHPPSTTQKVGALLIEDGQQLFIPQQ